MEIISIKDLTFSYPKTEYPVLNGINLSVCSGDMVLLMGDSAVGKSTLLRLLKAEIAPAGTISGDISVCGTVGYVSQNVYESIVSDRVRSELAFGPSNMDMSSADIELMVAETASYFNLQDKLDAEIASLSGGEVQMLNLASAMIMRPDILLLDEPTSQLDPVSADRFVRMVCRLNRDFSTTVVMVEHNLGDMIEHCDRIALMQRDADIISLGVDDMISYLRSRDDALIDMIPVHMRLYDGARTVAQCRSILSDMDIIPVPTEPVDTDRVIKARGISFAYTKGNPVLRDLDIDVYRGRINCVLGPNSGGKTTLLQALAGVRRPYSGRVKATGRISMLCQNVYDLFTAERCGDEVTFGSITDMLHIDYIRDRHPYDLSGGEAQRLALAKVLATGADIILLDEPTKGLDPMLKRELGALLRRLCDDGHTILLVSHDIEFVGEYADIVSFLSDGRIVATGTRREFFASLNFYTTSVSRITKGIADDIVSLGDLAQAGGVV